MQTINCTSSSHFYFHFLHTTISSARQQLPLNMLTVPDHTVVTRSRSRERGRREDEQERASAHVGLGLGVVPLLAGFLQEAGSPSGAKKELLSNLKAGSSRSRSRGRNEDWLPVRRSPRRNLSASATGATVKKVAFKTRATVLSLGGTEKEVGA